MKFVAVWENQFLQNVKLCSERIPGKPRNNPWPTCMNKDCGFVILHNNIKYYKVYSIFPTFLIKLFCERLYSISRLGMVALSFNPVTFWVTSFFSMKF